MCYVLCDKVLDACKYMGNGTLLSSPRCQNNGDCVNGTRSDSPGQFICDCAPGYTGQYCQQSTTALIRILALLSCIHDSIYKAKYFEQHGLYVPVTVTVPQVTEETSPKLLDKHYRIYVVALAKAVNRLDKVSYSASRLIYDNTSVEKVKHLRTCPW